MTSHKIALVTGAVSSSMLQVSKADALKLTKVPLLIYLTSRDESRGKDSLSRIHESQDLQAALESSSVKWHSLDITQSSSIQALADFIKSEHGKLDVLINNAGIATKGDTFNRDVVKTTLASNYAATRDMCRAFIPIMQKGGRIVNVSSMAGKLTKLSPELQARFRDSKLTIGGVDALMAEFESGVKGDQPPTGWPRAGYAVSKMGCTAMTKALARDHPDLLINAICPGYVNTDMTSGRGVKTIDEGAMTPTFAAIGDIGNATGEFFENCKISQW